MTDPAPRQTVTVPVPQDRVISDPELLRWGIVSTIRAPLRDIARFVAYHLDLGAAEIHLYLDEPDAETADFLGRQKAVKVTQCDDRYWRDKPQKPREKHQLRQAFNASRAYRRAKVDWLTHIDVDEFLLLPAPLNTLLAKVPADAAFARLRPAEMLAQPDPWQGPAHFKLTRHEAGRNKAALEAIYPDFGAFVPEGFISYTGGKNIARTGLANIRLGIHALMQNGRTVENGHILQGAHVGHAHAPSWEVFQRHYDFRMTRGSYRKKGSESMVLQDVLEFAQAQECGNGLRHFYDTMCLATPGLLARLAAHDMLITTTLDLDEKLDRWFAPMPKDAP